MRVFYVPEIVNDLAGARDWYESRSDGLGEDFVRMAYAGFGELLDFPEKYEEACGAFRRALMRRFPYSIYYQYRRSNHGIWSVSFFKGTRRYC